MKPLLGLNIKSTMLSLIPRNDIPFPIWHSRVPFELDYHETDDALWSYSRWLVRDKEFSRDWFFDREPRDSELSRDWSPSAPLDLERFLLRRKSFFRLPPRVRDFFRLLAAAGVSSSCGDRGRTRSRSSEHEWLIKTRMKKKLKCWINSWKYMSTEIGMAVTQINFWNVLYYLQRR